MENYVEDVFIVIEVGNLQESISKVTFVVKVYSNQYAADDCAYKLNEAAKRAGLPQRYAVICRGLYE